jgi:PAS domain S-box-containing protein
MVTDKNTILPAAIDLRRNAEERKQIDSAEKQRSRAKVPIQRLVHELEVYQIELEMQNEELSQCRCAAELSLERSIELYDSAPVGYCTFDRQGCVREANLTIAGMLGMERSRLLGQRFGIFISHDSRFTFAAFLEKVFANQDTISCELRLTVHGNSPTFVLIEAHAESTGLACRAAIINVSGRKRAEEAYHHLRQRLNWILEKTGTGMWFNELTLKRLTWDEQTKLLYFIEPLAEPDINLFWSRIHPDDRESTQRDIEAAIRDHTLCRIEHRAVAPVTGEIRWIHFAAQGTYAPDGTPTNFDGITSDITARKIIEEELQEIRKQLEAKVLLRTQELAESVDSLKIEIAVRERVEESLRRLNRLYAVLSGIGHAITRAGDQSTLYSDVCRIAVDQGGFILACIGLVNVEKGELRIAAANGATDCLVDILKAATTEPVGDRHHFRHHQHGATLYINNDFRNDPCDCFNLDKVHVPGILSSACVPLKQEGQVIGTLTLYSGKLNFFDQQHLDLLDQIGADISFAIDKMMHEASRRKAEHALQVESAERLRTLLKLRDKEKMLLQQNRLAAMGEMINNIAHQWRQPLNILGLSVQQMRMFYDNGLFSQEYFHESLSKSMGLINHMSRTIDDFRDFFKPDKEKSVFTIHEQVTKAISLIEDSFRSNNISIEIDIRANPSIVGFPNEYSQALLNILVNAKDALLERSHDNAKISVSITEEEDRAVVTVADNAGGISEEIMDKIFEPYFTTKGPNRGTGIGLFMSKIIIENNMDGRLSVCNSEEGAEFRIEV